MESHGMENSILWFMIINIYDLFICKSSRSGLGLGWRPQGAKLKEAATFGVL